jgi:hypothetical protein
MDAKATSPNIGVGYKSSHGRDDSTLTLGGCNQFLGFCKIKESQGQCITVAGTVVPSLLRGGPGPRTYSIRVTGVFSFNPNISLSLIFEQSNFNLQIGI